VRELASVRSGGEVIEEKCESSAAFMRRAAKLTIDSESVLDVDQHYPKPIGVRFLLTCYPQFWQNKFWWRTAMAGHDF
jgi:hypothetical protein